MTSWSVQDAKARFSELLDCSVAEGPQFVTRRGAETAVLVPIDQWRRLRVTARPTLKALMLSDEGRGDISIPPRGAVRSRTPPSIG
jgi:antitoxin Phd